MNNINVALTASLLLSILSPHAASEKLDGYHKNKNQSERSGLSVISENEISHLIYMREEEKLARDVYISLGMAYPNTKIFGNISVAETQHACKVCETLNRFDIEDPVTNDNVGIFPDDAFGDYFTYKYQSLISEGLTSKLDALYVGALIEELDMKDIKTCPDLIVNTVEFIKNSDDCGLISTKNPAIKSLYHNLIEGSESHLRSFVKQIEIYIGEGGYQAQIISQEEVDEILGRD